MMQKVIPKSIKTSFKPLDFKEGKFMFSKPDSNYMLRVNSGELMLSRLSLSFMLLVSSLSIASVAFGKPAPHGGETSGGSDQVVLSEILFATKTPTTQGVKICYEKGPAFKVSDSDVESILKWAFQSWADYIVAKDVSYAASSDSEGASLKVAGVKKGCSDGDDLHVFLGITPDSIKPTLKKMIRPLAATAAFSGYEKSYWQKGFIWLAPEGAIDSKSHLPIWPTPVNTRACDTCAVKVQYTVNDQFKKVILHEMGHVFGNNHVDRTIMSTDLYTWVLLDMKEAQENVWQGITPPIMPENVVIDSDAELLANPGLSKKYVLRTQYNDIPVPGATPFPGEGVSPTEINSHALADAFQLLVGIKPQGEVQGSVTRQKCPNYKEGRRADDQNSGDLQLTLTDSGKQYNIQISVKNKVSQHEDSAPLFNGQYGNHHHSLGFAFFGMIHPLVGKPIPVIVNYNMGLVPFSVVRLGNGKEESFLTGNLQ